MRADLKRWLLPSIITLVLGTAAVTSRDERPMIEKGAIRELRALGAAQLAYQDANNNKDYASWKSLTRFGRIRPGSSRGTLIGSYSLAEFWADNASEDPRCIYACCDSTFTIVALPLNQLSGLRSFDLCDDQTVRVASTDELNIIPNRGNEIPKGDCPCYWEPVR